MMLTDVNPRLGSRSCARLITFDFSSSVACDRTGTKPPLAGYKMATSNGLVPPVPQPHTRSTWSSSPL